MQNAECDIERPLPVARQGEGAAAPRAHGGNIRKAVRQYDLDERRILDFSSNINPLGPSPMAMRAAKSSLRHVDRYPDPDMTELRAAIARYFGIKPGQVVCGSGSNGLIHHIPRVFRPRKALLPAPTFTEYAAAVEAGGGEAVLFPLDERGGFRVDPVDMAFAFKGMDMAFLCNPNNPTGRLIPRQEMLEIVRLALRENVRLVIDEAFIDFAECESLVKEAALSGHLICLRAFTKFFGMPGLRVGYAVCGDDVARALRAAQEPWSVTIPAERAAIAALGDWRYIKKTRASVEKERERLLGELRLLPGVETFPPAANFILFKLKGISAHELTDRLAQRSILVRDCSNFPGLGGSFIRVAVRGRRENKRLVRTLRELLIR